jgi:hypothetical protein
MKTTLDSLEYKLKTIEITKFVIRMLIGGLFILTATLKLFSLDQFELYVYSFGIFNYLMVTVLVRLLIAFELLMGIFLIAKIYYKPVWWLTMASLAGFTLLLIYVAIFRNDTNCHCFGDFVELDPAKSIIKNVITMILLLLIYKEKDYRFKFKKWVTGIGFATAIILPFFVFPMDSLYNKFKDPHGKINTQVFENVMKDSVTVLRIDSLNSPSCHYLVSIDSTKYYLQADSGKYVIGFFISQCKYCKLSIQKLNSIFEKNNLDKNHVKLCISGNNKSINNFVNETKADDYQYYKLSPFLLIDITYGKFPMYVMINNGKISSSMDLRGINEKELIEFLSK